MPCYYVPVNNYSLQNRVMTAIETYQHEPDTSSLNQHFLIDERVLSTMVSHLGLASGETVLEIGAGFGFYTELLAKKARAVTVIEIDPSFEEPLFNIRKKYRNVSIEWGDFLEAQPRFFRVITGCLPFSISEPFLKHLSSFKFRRGLFLFGKRFAESLRAEQGTSGYGFMSMYGQSFFDVSYIGDVAPESFYPVPSVWGALVGLIPVDPEKLSFRQIFLRFFVEQEKKNVRNALESAHIAITARHGAGETQKQARGWVGSFGLDESILATRVSQLSNEQVQVIVSQLKNL